MNHLGTVRPPLVAPSPQQGSSAVSGEPSFREELCCNGRLLVLCGQSVAAQDSLIADGPTSTNSDSFDECGLLHVVELVPERGRRARAIFATTVRSLPR